ncbi:family 78 glycoside hydrolase catalytic domain [Saliterribacillus persicus]|uniref:Alpha-L-rhamnosidase-like protein n=1 Tax=Saliterribacillus persicus TaxID=930114 RepID=A0A368Y1F0_9BACI|nr:family 78 glycoside hydrolase catalytic domain [Saliterribacillus persicus]RCW73186.1 alpha-L-rhamnosidase-like protein [Saliterribacillus persicus]
MSFQTNISHEVIRSSKLEEKAKELKPELFRKKIIPEHIVEVVENEEKMHGWEINNVKPASELSDEVLGKDNSLILDFGDHQVGYLSLSITPVGSPPDAPLHMRLTFGEMPVEMAESFSTYDGWISSSWLQEETIHVDVLPSELKLPRRYSFRYLKIEVLDTSPKYKVSFQHVAVETITSGDEGQVEAFVHDDEELVEIDRVSIKTLQDCMQDVFEDGPKRDRRLWLGDLRLQAMANYATFKNNDLVKRNLYQFAAVPNQNGQVSANLFVEPSLIPDDTFLFDYSLFFTTTLYDYYQATKDIETLKELWPIAYRQVEIGLERLDDKGIVQDDDSWWSFIDWHPDLNKQSPSQAILIYTLKRAILLAQELKEDTKIVELENHLEKVMEATHKYLWKDDIGFFVSGDKEQISWATQVWMVIAGVLDEAKSRELLLQVLDTQPEVEMNTPYMHHHLVEALFEVGLKKEATDWMRMYWGGMLRDGADTFWELYNPKDKTFSPYGNHLINSYCHAWSCTPTYLIRKYLN